MTMSVVEIIDIVILSNYRIYHRTDIYNNGLIDWAEELTMVIRRGVLARYSCS